MPDRPHLLERWEQIRRSSIWRDRIGAQSTCAVKWHPNAEVREAFGDEVGATIEYGVVRKRLKEIAHAYMNRTDGYGDASKMYWMQGEEEMIPAEPYTFPGYVLWKETPDNAEMRRDLETFALQALARTGKPMPPRDHSIYIVICRYDVGEGVGPHQDNDYESKYDYIVSFTPLGQASFGLQPLGTDWKREKSFTEVLLSEAKTIVFNRFMKHMAKGALTPRINFTARWAFRRQKPIFTGRTEWPGPTVKPPGTGERKQ
jgi:hypothetical protein